MLIIIEGCEGTGKSTQAEMLFRNIREGLTPKVHLTREPGGDMFLGSKIRDIVLDKDNDWLDPRTEFFLYLADRAQHVAQTICPPLQRGDIVICDRFQYSTYAYQVYARGLGYKETDMHEEMFPNHLHGLHVNMMAYALGWVQPNLVFYMEGDIEECLRRAGKKGLDRIESEGIEFHKKVAMGYRKAFQTFRVNPFYVNAMYPPEEASEVIFHKVEEMFHEKQP